jgi:hypothetical protein
MGETGESKKVMRSGEICKSGEEELITSFSTLNPAFGAF